MTTKMKKIIFILIIIAIIAAGLIFWLWPANSEKGCTLSGGTIGTSLCCKLTSDFPNSCAIGACGCSPANSREVKTCACGEGQCFNGRKCEAVKTNF